MSTPAQVRSTDAIEAFDHALVRFAERVGNALDALNGELHRADGWIDHDRPAHWRNQKHEAEEAVHQAKLELERCLMMTTVDGQRPACREQKDAVTQAKARLDYCREKVEVVKKWQRGFRHDSMEYQGRIGQLRRVLDQDVPNARAVLAKVVHHVVQYELERAPDAFAVHRASPSAIPSGAAESTARPAPPEAPASPAAAAPASKATPSESPSIPPAELS